MLVAVAVIGVGLLAVSAVWSTTARREKLAQLDWIGGQFTQAIASYYYGTPAGAKTCPSSLQELLDDRRFPMTRRHLREVYPDPFTGRIDWEPLGSSTGGVCGVRIKLPEPLDDGRAYRAYVFTP